MVYLRRTGHTKVSDQIILTTVSLVVRPTEALLTDTATFQDMSRKVPSRDEQRMNTNKCTKTKEKKRRGGKTMPQSDRITANSNRRVGKATPQMSEGVHVKSKFQTAMHQARGGGKTRPQRETNNATKAVKVMLKQTNANPNGLLMKRP
jgi:hypothetical protein